MRGKKIQIFRINKAKPASINLNYRQKMRFKSNPELEIPKWSQTALPKATKVPNETQKDQNLNRQNPKTAYINSITQK